LSIFEAILLGLVQGLAEFLPISSSGHLALLQHFFGIEGENVLIFAVMLHVGTLFSVFAVYWQEIKELFLELMLVFRDIFTGKGLRIHANETRRLGFLIIVATIPTAIIGFAFRDTFASLYLSLTAIGVSLLITGTLLWAAERMNKGQKQLGEMKFRYAIVIGIFQGLAIAPGISRSGSTLVGGLFSGLEKNFAIKFAFLISIPSIIGSVVLELPEALRNNFDASLFVPILIGVIVSALSGFVAIKTMIRVVSGKKLIIFSCYTWLLGALVLGYTFFM
jgi:undecaprenyl-diphosphatase